ncbi:MAG: DUF2797 domain-containing protein [Candidatus Heimdallarchaeota archaeon]|nr:DUF2797 domain-containing protein [Candidatus Heimdallarchaeota archaeon]
MLSLVLRFVLHTGWKLKPSPKPFLLLAKNNQSLKAEILELNSGGSLHFHLSNERPKFCVGYNNHFGERVPCPDSAMVRSYGFRCQRCSFHEFFLCRAICNGDVCQPSSEAAKKHCWQTTTGVYLTSVAGILKVGTSTNPLRRWLEQGSDAGVVIAEGVGLIPRALEYEIGQLPAFRLAVRMNQKLKHLGVKESREELLSRLENAIDEIFSLGINSEILFPLDTIPPITFLDEYYGAIPKMNTQPIIKKIGKKGLELSGTIVGIKGMILVIKTGQTYQATNLSRLIGRYIELSKEPFEKKGQRSLFEFVTDD